jgi:serine/threonine protein kinase/Tol biopolymer transport system component
MSLHPGLRLGPYELIAPLGAGGMGEVFKARDTRLDRTVAIKVLAPHAVDDPSTRTRFEREARAISSLDHPNICTIYDVGRDGEVEYIVMQYFEGETLAARIARGPLPLDDALRYATEIASALDRAHRAGILHRDLKPGNVMLAKSAGHGTSAHLLDFGLAKILPTGPVHGSGTVAATVTTPLTGSGTILGTLLYMSPEQLEGQPVDARSDIFSFGAVVYEMVTGRRAFDGASQASIIGAILERDPPPMPTLVPLTPPALDRVVRKCLAKDRERRWQTAADLCDELAWITQSSSVTVPHVPVKHNRRGPPKAALAVTAVALAALLGAAWWMTRDDAGTAVTLGTRRLTIGLPNGLYLSRGGIAISPDGASIVFVASDAPESNISLGSRGAWRLYQRRFDSTEVIPIAGTDGARGPFFSPDGTSVGYFTSGAVMKVPLGGGPPSRVASVPPVARGGAWLPDGSIVVTPHQSSGLMRIAAGENVATVLTTPDERSGERAHQWPYLVPGGTHLLYTIRRGTTTEVDSADIGVLDLATGERRVLLKGAAFAQYSPTGHLVFVRGNTLSAAPFDIKSMTVGTAISLRERVAVDPWAGGAHYNVAPDGTLVFYHGTFGSERRLPVWVDANGKSTPLSGMTGGLPGRPRLARDGTRFAYDATSPAGDDEIYVFDVARGTSVAISGSSADDFNPTWTADGSRLVWTALPVGRMPYLVARAADGTGLASEVLQSAEAQFAGSVSPSGVLAFTHAAPGPVADIWIVALDGGDPKATRFVGTPANEYGPEFSPDGHWLAYVSDEGGSRDVYVVPYPGPGAKRKISASGGVAPAWSRDGTRLYFQSGDAMMVADVGGKSFSPPRRLFSGSFVVDSREDAPREYDIGPDGRFLMFVREWTAADPPELRVISGWR